MKFSLPARLLLGLLAVWTATAADHSAEFNSRIWQSDEGLPLDNAQAVVQSSDGYLWIGTQNGLARFDGARFYVFDSRNVPELKNPNILGLAEGKDGSLWMATAGGLNRYREGKFYFYGTKEGLADNLCLGPIFCDSGGTIWIATREGLCQFKNGKFTVLTSAKGLSSSEIRSICQDLEGRMWFATARGVDCWKDGVFISHFTAATGFAFDDCRAVYCDHKGKVWLAAGDKLFQVVKNKPKLYIQRTGRIFNIINRLFEDREGNFWVGTFSGLDRVVHGQFKAELNNSRQAYGKVNDFFEDRENNLWVGTRDGLVRLKANRLQCFTEENGLANNNIMSVLETKAGNICIGTWGGGLSIMSEGTIKPYSNHPSLPMMVLGLCEDRSSHLWIGTDYRGGLFESVGEDIRHFTADDGEAFPSIRVVFQDHWNHLWVGSAAGLYLHQGDKLFHYDADPHLLKDDIRAMHEDEKFNLWVGTGKGLARLGDHEITWFRTTNGLSSDLVMSIFEDDQHDIWVGTGGGGLNRLHQGKWTSYGTRQGLFSDNIYEILEDDAHWLWIGCERGIFRVSRKNLDDYQDGKTKVIQSISYGRTEGMLNNICTSVSKPSAVKSHDGRLWFATVKGLCVIDPKKEDTRQQPSVPPVVIDDMLVDRQSIGNIQGNGESISVPPGRGELEFHYAALSFRASENNRYKYKLEGVDSDWVDSGVRQTAHYNNISPGHYVFRVIASNSDGVWNEVGAKLGLDMVPHFWQERWFRPAMFALVAAMLILIWRIRVARRVEIEHLRLRIAADLHDEIGSNLASISLLSQLSEKTERSELFEINRIALSTAQSIREIVWFINPDYDTLPEMVVRMKEVAAQMLIGLKYNFHSEAGTGRGKLSLELRRNFFLIFKEILHNVAKHSGAKNVEIHFTEARGVLTLRISDDGKGFDLSAARRGNGLKNMRLRSGKLGGTLDIKSFPGEGAVVTLSVHIP